MAHSTISAIEVSHAWLDGRREFLSVAESLSGLAYRPMNPTRPLAAAITRCYIQIKETKR